ncbi:MAG: hypothetical protein GOVbin1096_72 [Prokaryotic dsDNA virus sp.]|jgi:hypothetical protein|nr:MAG: hypothetical protein GOVbin1096_72 [Prokaryotic dsDNA virus sp.]|tara:strand:- start:3664 stop:4155 length:492 start_codon:yes stop_codon:yes gene_type:complete
MNVYDLVRTALYNSSKKIITDNQVIHSHQGGQEPRGTYCAINVLRADKIGMEYNSTYAGYYNDNLEILSRNEYETIVRFMFVGKDAGDLAYHFEAVMDNAASRFHFGTENLAVMRKSEVRRVPEKRDTTWVASFTLDVTFSYAVEITQAIDIIEDVSWNATIN